MVIRILYYYDCESWDLAI